MNYEDQLKLQAYLDGELPEAEAREVANWLAKDREAVALHAELRNTRQAMVGLEIGTELPESREFFWSKIEREIEGVERPAPVRPAPSMFAAWRRVLRPAAAFAALVIAAVVVNNEFNIVGRPGVAKLEASRSDPGTFTYHDFSAGATLVWLSYPAEEEVAQIQPASFQ